MAQETKFCSECGQAIPVPNPPFCSQCGAGLNSQIEDQTSIDNSSQGSFSSPPNVLLPDTFWEKVRSQKNYKLFVVFGGGLVLAAIFGVIFGDSGPKPSTSGDQASVRQADIKFMEFGKPVTNDQLSLILVKTEAYVDGLNWLQMFVEATNISESRSDYVAFVKFDAYSPDRTTWLGTCTGSVPPIPPGQTWRSSDSSSFEFVCSDIEYRPDILFTFPY